MRVLFHDSYSVLHGAAYDFPAMYEMLIKELKTTIPNNRGRWQSEDVSKSDAHSTHELNNVVFISSIPSGINVTKEHFKPDLPWAELHFQERVSGTAMNPPPSYAAWPHHSATERDRFLGEEGKFDHTYPERFWPRHAGDYWSQLNLPATGIRFPYGDLGDVVELLKRDPLTRQAYLPIFFPEDTGGNSQKHDVSPSIRVPCTLGYHFIRNGPALDCNYFIRSCDVVRHFRNDAYMAARLTQWIVRQLQETNAMVWMGNLTMFISNLHLFKGDVWRV